jgi:hypothetical protein
LGPENAIFARFIQVATSTPELIAMVQQLILDVGFWLKTWHDELRDSLPLVNTNVTPSGSQPDVQHMTHELRRHSQRSTSKLAWTWLGTFWDTSPPSNCWQKVRVSITSKSWKVANLLKKQDANCRTRMPIAATSRSLLARVMAWPAAGPALKWTSPVQGVLKERVHHAHEHQSHRSRTLWCKGEHGSPRTGWKHGDPVKVARVCL